MCRRQSSDEKELKTEFVDDCVPHATDKVALASLKQAWREMSALTQQRIDRSAKGIPEEHADDPLPEGIQRGVDEAFRKFYGGWQLRTVDKPCLALVGRCKREADRNGPTMYAASKARSCADATKTHESKKRRIGDDIFLDTAEDVPIAGSHRLRGRLHQYSLLGTAWAMAGCFKPPGRTDDKLYTHWRDTWLYVQQLRDRTEPLLDQFDEDTVVDYLTAVEEEVRAKAFEVNSEVRDPPVLWSEVLL